MCISSRPRRVPAAFQALICAAPIWGGHGKGLAWERGGHQPKLRAAGSRARGRAWTEFEECMDMLARAGTIGSTGYTAAVFTCPREAAHARA
jgi:gamma-glutamyl:cysteine ligase YbdK (ATP-grasp superfamily)